MKKILTLILLSFLFTNISYSEVVNLKCSFVLGDQTKPKKEWGIGDQPDEYLKINFEEEKIVEAPYYENKFVSNPVFWQKYVSWNRLKKNKYMFFAELNRETGVLNIVWNKLPTNSEAYSTEHVYQCKKSEFKF